MHIPLDLCKHCIETELKQQHNHAVSAYFRASTEEKQKLEQVIALTRYLLEELDFGRLRSVYPQLAGGTRAVVELVQQGVRLEIVINGEKIEVCENKKSSA